MPTHKQNMVESVPREYAQGSASTQRLQGIYSASPIYLGEITNSGLVEQYQTEVMDAVINDNGHTFGTFDTSFTEAPDLAEVETGGGGLPATPYVPNPTSPGPGSMDPTKQAEAPEGFGENPNSQWGSGVGHALQPKASSEKISSQKLGDYVMGAAAKE